MGMGEGEGDGGRGDLHFYEKAILYSIAILLLVLLASSSHHQHHNHHYRQHHLLLLLHDRCLFAVNSKIFEVIAMVMIVIS